MFYTQRPSLLTTIFAAALLAWAGNALAANPASVTITDTSGAKTYTAGPFFAPNPTPNLNADLGPRCDATSFSCDSFALTTSLPANYATLHPYDQFKVTLSWPASATAAGRAGSDYDIYAYQGAVGDLDGSKRSFTDSATAKNPEVFTLPAYGGDKPYTLKTVPFQPGGEILTVSIELVAGSAPNPATGLPPRFKSYPSPATLGNSAGEPSIGYNFKSKNAMFLANLQTLRVTFAEYSGVKDEAGLALPESCDATWQNKSTKTTSTTTTDPILWTDSKSGRSFVSQQTTGPQAAFSFTDDDGETYTPASAAPPNGGVDHQTVGTGPYPPTSQFKSVATVPYATYYCSQNVASATCARSDTGGANFNAGVAIFTAPESTVRPVDNQFDCNTFDGGIHGHVKVAPDGTVYVPPKDCGSVKIGIGQAEIVSEDAGLTWTTRLIPGTTADTEIDPSVGIDAANKIYHCYVAHDGHAHVITSTDHGRNWANDYDIGVSQSIETADFPEAVGGDSGRAACAFIGTTVRGNHDAADFKGVWYGFMAQTYDGGKTWHTVNVTPGDPVQGVGGVCNGGTLCNTGNRNLLDFNEITIDEKGRPLFGFADGCIGACATDPVGKAAFSRKASIVRQTAGRSLIAAFDKAEPAKPAASCIAGNRDLLRAQLSWLVPDNGGAEIANYKIFRSLSPTVFPDAPIATTQDAKSNFDDTTADPNVPVYYYKITALNSVGEGVYSNTIKLPIAGADPNICVLPGITVLNDASNDVFATNGVTPPQNTPYYDIQQLAAAQPYFMDGSYKYVFRFKVASLSTVPPGSTWAINFCTSAFACTGSNAALSATNKFYTVQMVTAGSSTPSFQLLKPNAADIARATVAITTDAGFTPAGLITITVNASDLGLTKAGAGSEKLLNFIVNTSNSARTADVMPDSGTPAGSVTTVPLAQCAPNTAPVAVLGATPQKGQGSTLLVQFDGGGSSDADAGDFIANYRFDFGDGSPVVNQSGATTSHTYQQSGNYNASLLVTDSRGLVSANTAEKVIQLLPTNNPPAPVLSVTPSSGFAPLSVTLDGSASSDPDAGDKVASYRFDFGDGSALAVQPGATISHVYQLAGTYTAMLTVVDSQGLASQGVATQNVTAVNRNNPPTAALTATPQSGTVPFDVMFDGSGSSDPDAGDRVASYHFEFDDGSFGVVQAGATITHNYRNVGSHTATLVVTDSNGLQSSNTAAVVINAGSGTPPPFNSRPTARVTATPTTGTVPLTVLLDGSTSSDADAGDRVAAYSFDYGDGSAIASSASATISHTYTRAGRYTVKLTVTDSRGASSSVPGTVDVTVNAAVAPTGNINPVTGVAEGRFGGGSLGAGWLLTMAGATALRRRQRRHAKAQ